MEEELRPALIEYVKRERSDDPHFKKVHLDEEHTSLADIVSCGVKQWKFVMDDEFPHLMRQLSFLIDAMRFPYHLDPGALKYVKYLAELLQLMERNDLKQRLDELNENFEI
jgi:hypothetical protein